MAVLDAGSVYTNTGDILQIRYAQKAADCGNTVICLKNKYGVVCLVEKPIDSSLYIPEKNLKIVKVTDNIYQVASGLETDLKYVNTVLKERLIDEKNTYESDISYEKYRSEIVNIVHMFTKYSGARPLGINIMSLMKYKDEYKVLVTDCSGRSLFYKSAVIGKGSRVAKTELEKLDLDNMVIKDLISNGIRILYKSYDPLKDMLFDIEIGVMCKNTNGVFVRLAHSEYSEYVEMYKDFSVDGEE